MRHYDSIGGHGPTASPEAHPSPARRLAMALSGTMALALCGSAMAREHSFGPLPVAEAWLASGSGFLSLPVEAPPAPQSEPGRWQVTTSLGLSSFWLRSPAVSEVIEARSERGPVTVEELDGIAPWPGPEGIYFADAELHRLTVDVRRRFAGRLELGLRTSIVDAGGGVLDPVIEGFHDLFGRERVQRMGGKLPGLRIRSLVLGNNHCDLLEAMLDVPSASLLGIAETSTSTLKGQQRRPSGRVATVCGDWRLVSGTGRRSQRLLGLSGRISNCLREALQPLFALGL